MEIVYFILFFFGIMILRGIITGVREAKKEIAQEQGTSFQTKLVHQTFDPGDGGSHLQAQEIQAKGAFPIKYGTNLGFIISVFDKSPDGEFTPILSALQEFQEPDSIVFQHRIAIGRMMPNRGFPEWVSIGVVPLDLIQPPYSGKREISVVIRMIDTDSPPNVMFGFSPEKQGIIWEDVQSFTHTFTEKGYEEEAEHRDEAIGIALKIGMSVAMADGSLDDAEGETLKSWILRAISPYEGEKKETLKSLYNTAMKEAYSEAKTGNLILSNLTSRLNEIGERTLRYETIQLCINVMSADGVADAEELKTIHNVAGALNIDMQELTKMIDGAVISLEGSVSAQASIEEVVGVDKNWDNDQTRNHLRKEYMKWNNRLTSLPEGNERDNAQEMMDNIGKAIKKYE